MIFGIPRDSGPQNFSRHKILRMIMHTVQSIRVLYVLVYVLHDNVWYVYL